MNLRDKLRAQNIIRWQIVDVEKKQSIAEHTFNVMLIAYEISKESGLYAERGYSEFLEYLMHHDLPEVLTGDIPTVTKVKIGRKLFDDLDKKIEPLLGRWESMYENSYFWHVFKVSELIEIIYFLMHRRGNEHQDLVLQSVWSDYDDYVKALKKMGVADEMYEFIHTAVCKVFKDLGAEITTLESVRTI